MSTIMPQDLIAREVHYCVSSLVHTLATGYATAGMSGDLDDLCEQAQELSYPIEDHKEAADDATGRWSRDECVEYLTSLDIECRDDEAIETLREAVIVNAKEEGIVEFCEEHGIEPHEREIYEHWIISGWLADKLKAKGERVDRDFAGLTVWGRTTTGQAIYMDAVIQEIHADLIAR